VVSNDFDVAVVVVVVILEEFVAELLVEEAVC